METRPKYGTMPELTEKVFQKQVIELAEALGWRTYHPFLSKWSEKGYPDLTCVHARQKRICFIELKRESGKVSPHQQEWHNLLIAAGQEAYIFRPSQFDQIEQTLKGGAK